MAKVKKVGQIINAQTGDVLVQMFATGADNDAISVGLLICPDYAECKCGHDELAKAWRDANPHTQECYSEVRDQRIEEWKILNPEPEMRHKEWTRWYDKRDKAEDRISRALCLELDIPWNDGRGSAVHCTCVRKQRAQLWFAENDHDARCPIASIGGPPLDDAYQALRAAKLAKEGKWETIFLILFAIFIIILNLC